MELRHLRYFVAVADTHNALAGVQRGKITVPVLVMHGDDDQIVQFGSSVPRAVDLLKNGSLKAYEGYPHGMLTTHADVVNPDLLAFIRS